MDHNLAILVILIALCFDFTNGFHDAANAIAVAISTRALPPKIALGVAVVMNLLGALMGTEVANTIATSIVNIDPLSTSNQLIVILAALIGATCWNFFTWYFGIPSSSSHTLIGSLAGAGIAAHFINNAVYVHWDSVMNKVVIPMFSSPVIGFILAYVIMSIVMMICKNFNPGKMNRRFRFAQIFSSSLIALGHGLQDAQKTMGIVFMAAIAMKWVDPSAGIPFWIKLLAAFAIAAGTSSGGFKIMKTLGRKIFDIDPPRGFVAELVASSVLYTTAYWLHAPISTTHIITTAVMGVGATKRLSAVRWGVAKNIVITWFLTLPATALVSCIVYFPLLHIVNFISGV